MLTVKNIVICLVALLFICVAVIVYRMYFLFNQNEIKIYVLDECEKYTDKTAAYNIIMDAVDYILSSHNLTQQVLASAKASNADRNQELVHAAIMQSKNFNYLPA